MGLLGIGIWPRRVQSYTHLHAVPAAGRSAHPCFSPPSAGNAAARRRRRRRLPDGRAGPALPGRLWWRRGFLPRPWAPRGAGRHASADRPAGLRPHQFFHDRSSRNPGRPAGAYGAVRHQPRLFRQRRIRGGGSGDEAGAPVFRGNRRARTPPFHCATAELPREHAGGAGGGGKCLAQGAVCPAAD